MSGTDVGSRKQGTRWKLITAIVLMAIVLVEAAILTIKWPFTRDRMAESLGRSTGSTVFFRVLRKTYLPHPGIVAEQVSFVRGSGGPLATVRRLRVQGSWAALITFQRYVPVLEAEGLEVRLSSPMPPPVPRESHGSPEATIGSLVAHGAVLHLPTSNPKANRLTFPKLALRNVAKTKPIDFHVEAQLLAPSGRLAAQGQFGPWNSAQKSQTPLKGSFHMTGDLAAIRHIRGRLTANGKFSGRLGSVRVEGGTDAPDFAVKRHPVHLRTSYRASVDATKGDITIEALQASFLRTILNASGAIAGGNVVMDFVADEARIQDLLTLFTSGDRPALKGPIVLRARAELPPGDGPFLAKLRLDGRFGIEDGTFSKARTQAKVNELSARSRGKDVGEDEPRPEEVVSDLKGSVTLRNGVAQLSNVSFSVPGATATGGGVYNLRTKVVDLHGRVRMEAEASEAAGGFKGLLLKPFNALFRKKHRPGAVMPVSVTGRYPRPKFAVSPTGG